jgi:RNA polymerase sigma-70 factor (ECF subfamily)
MRVSMNTCPLQSARRSSPGLNATIRAKLPKLLARAKRFCRNSSDAHDLVQDTCEHALRSSRCDALCEEATLFTIMRNLWIDEWRRRQRQISVSMEEDVAATRDAAPSVALEARFETALASLDADVRSAFDMRFRENLSYDEIARHLEIPKSTVGTRLFRARRQIHALVAAQ